MGLFWLFVLCFSLCEGIIDQNECPYPTFPSDLSGAAYLGFDHEIHLHDTYRFNFSSSGHTTYLTVTERSLLRMSAFSAAFDVSLIFREEPQDDDQPTTNAATTAPSVMDTVSSQGGVGVEQTLHFSLDPGSYRIVFDFGGMSSQACETMLVALGIVPVARLSGRIVASQTAVCPAGSPASSLPLVAANVNAGKPSWSIDYDSEVSGANLYVPSFVAGGGMGTRFFYSLNFSVPTLTVAANSLWRVEAELGFDFVNSGSLGLLVSGATQNVVSADCPNCANGLLRLANRKVVDLLLPAGDYRLWLYDLPLQRFARNVTASCTPFTFRVSASRQYEVEDFLSCEEPSIPSSFDAPGFMQQDGSLDVIGKYLLDVSNRIHRITFRRTSASVSLFRLKVAENDRVDIDVRLLDPAGQLVDQSNSARPFEEILTAQLDKIGLYTIEISYFYSVTSVKACDTFELIVKMEAASALEGYCATMTDHPLVVPDPSPQLNDGETHRFKFVTLSDLPASYVNRSALNFSLTFHVGGGESTNARLLVRVGQDFLVGHLRVALSRQDEPQARVVVARQISTATLEVWEYLEPGYYTLTIAPGLQSRTANSTLFPKCVAFAFEMRLIREAAQDTDPLSQRECWQWPELPDTLEQPQYLSKVTRQTYLSGTFLMPSGSYLKHVIAFDGSNDGDDMLRAYVDPHEELTIDLDLVLLENDIPVASSQRGSGRAEQVVYRLKSKAEYKLEVYMFRLGGNTRCNSFGFEMAVKPVPADLWSGPCWIDNLPPANLLASSQRPWDYTHTYSFTQSVNVTQTFNLTLAVVVPTYIRLQVWYEFIWGALYLSLKDSHGFPIRMGTGGENSNNIGPVRLAPGNYTVEIGHSSIPFAVERSTSAGELTIEPSQSVRCTGFQLHVAIDDADPDAEASEHGCSLYGLPASLSSAASAHPLSGNRFHFARHVLVESDLGHPVFTSFTLPAPALFRVFIPDLPSLDVDIALKKGSDSIFSTFNADESARVRRLDAGDYTFATQFYARAGATLPSTKACAWYPLQLELIPMDAVIASPAHLLGGACANVAPPTSIDEGSSLEATSYSHPVSGTQAFVHDIRLNVATTTLLDMVVESQFATSQIWFKVFRAGSLQPPLLPVMSESSATFYDELDPGNWTIRLYQPRGDDGVALPADVACNTFTLRYTTTGGVMPGLCRLIPFPSNVFSLQDSDGSFFLTGDNYRAPPLRQFTTIAFNVTTQSVLRAFAQSDSNTFIDTDMAIFANFSMLNSSRPLASFSSSANYESAFIILNASSTPYLLEIRTFSTRHLSSFDCPSLFFTFALEPVVNVLPNRACVFDLPSNLPPSSINVLSNHANFSIQRTDYRIGATTLASFVSGEWFRIPITLEVRESTRIKFDVFSNFLAHTVYVTTGYAQAGFADATPNTGDDVENFVVSVERVYTPGAYSFFLEGRTHSSLFEAVGETRSHMCVKFSLGLTATQTNGVQPPRFVAVSPTGVAKLSAKYDLQVSLTVDHIIDVPSAGSFFRDLLAQELVYLTRSTSQSVKILPSGGFLYASRMEFSVTFSRSNFHQNETFELHVNVNGFQSGNVSFSSAITFPTFTIDACTCSGHGKCLANSVCVCDTGYMGAECQVCAVGYHGAGSSCLPDPVCAPHSCGDHGNCTIRGGAIECTCEPGFVSVGESPCSVCATGFEPDPQDPNKCISAEDDSAVQCGLSLLPTSLDGPGFLGFDQSVHFSGRYYMDVHAGKHETFFELKSESVLRVYVAVHVLDVDIFVSYDLGQGQASPTHLFGSYAYGGEEVIFKVMPPGRYALTFKYNPGWNAKYSVCESAVVELAISPSLVVRASNNNSQDKCNRARPSESMFDASPFNNSQAATLLVEGVDVTYRPLDTVFSVSAVDPRPPSSGRRIVGRRSFTTPRRRSAMQKVAHLTVELAYHFETGDLGLVLEEGLLVGTTFGCSMPSALCHVGSNGYDRNSLRMYLKPGTTYTLWVYEPFRQNVNISTCSLFQYSVEINWRDPLISGDLGCAGGRMPEVLLDQDTGLHWRESLALTEATQNTTLMVGTGGKRLRVGINLNVGDLVEAEVEGATLRLIKVSDGSIVSTVFATASNPIGMMYLVVPAGTYVLSLDMEQVGRTSRCRTVDVELAVEKEPWTRPTTMRLGCPVSEQDVLPAFPVPLEGSFDLRAMSGDVLQTYYTFATEGGVFMSIPFTVSQESLLSTSVWSAFFTAPVSLQVFGAGASTPLATSFFHYNEAKLSTVRLQAGSFLLKVSLVSPLTDLACAPFHMTFHLQPSRTVESATPNTDSLLSTIMCESLEPEGYEHLPSTLNSWKYLNFDGRVDFHSDRVLMPVQIQVARTVTRQTKVRLSTPSLLRIASEVDPSSTLALSLRVINVDKNDTVVASSMSGWLLFASLDANTNYVLNWTVINYASDPVVAPGAATWCRSVALHMTIAPKEWSLQDAALCPGGSKFPQNSLVPSGVPSKISPFVTGDLSTYYVQQSSQGAVSKSFEFSLDAPSNVLVELRFDFIDIDLRIVLRESSSWNGHGSTLSATGSFMLANGLPAGRYYLAIMESPTQSSAQDASAMKDLLRCRPFGFRLTVERDDAAKVSSRNFFPIPDTLNDIGYLDYEGSLHIAHEYELEDVNLNDASKVSEYTNMTVTSNSTLRINMRIADDTDEQELVPLVRVIDLTTPASSMARPVQGDPHALLDYQLIVGHSYRIAWSAKQRFLQGVIPMRDVPVFVELSIKPNNVLRNSIVANAAYHGDCPASSALKLPSIVPDPTNNGFLYANDALVLTSAQVRQQGVVSSTQFTVSDDSVLTVLLETQFSLAHVELALFDVNRTGTEAHSWTDRNRRMLHEVLQAGTYVLSVVQSWTENVPPPVELNHCSVVSLHIALRPGWQGSSTHIADCTSFHLLPWNMSNPAPYGRPMNPNTAELVVYGNKFLYPERPQSSANTLFSFVQVSLPAGLQSVHMVLFFEVNLAQYQPSSAATSFSMLAFDRMNTPFSVAAYGDQSSRTTRMARFRIEESVGAIIQLAFAQLAAQVGGSCPYYTFGSYTLDTELLANTMLCTQAQLDSIKSFVTIPPPVDQGNNTAYLHFSGSLNSIGSVLRSTTTRLTVNRTSMVHYALTHNAFVSSLEVTFNVVGSTSIVQRGSLSILPAYEDHLTNARVVGTTLLSVGEYEVTVSHKSLTFAGGLTNEAGMTVSGAGLCLPFLMDMWMTPYTRASSYVIGVEPAQMWALKPHQPLDINIVVDSALNGQNQQPATLDDLMGAFVLESNQRVEFFPDSASIGAPGKGVWLRWNAFSLDMGKTFTLKLRQRKLTGPGNVSVQLFSNHTYSTISSDFCGANGVFSSEYLCVCKTGWGGVDCSVCGIGFVANKEGQCVRTSRPICQPCSCGCDAQNGELGVCDDSSGSIVCHCSPSYTGPTCNLCVDSSQQASYPLCIAHPKECATPCVHGVCDRLEGKCRCEHFWKGEACDQCPKNYDQLTCDRCAVGYSGSSCTQDGWSVFEMAAAGAAVVLLVVALIIVILAIRRWRNKKNMQRQAYAMTSMGSLTSDGDDGDDFFDDSISSHEPAPGLLSDQFNLHLSDEDDDMN